MQIQNRFAGKCAKCRTPVDINEGVAHKTDGGRWTTYCVSHAPEQIVAKKTITERMLTVHGEVVMPYEPANLPILKSMPGARWDKETKTWTVSLREQDRMRVLEMADKLGLEVAPELRQLYPAVSIPLPDTLYPFQKTGVEWLARREKSLLADQMGLGKSAQTLMALSPEDRTIVVCPASLKYNWEKECKTWRPDLNPRVVNSTDGALPIPKPGDVIVINFDILPDWLLKERADMPEAVGRLEGVALVIDEAHLLANYKSQRSRKIAAFREHFAKKVIALTGTPMTNNPGNLESVLKATGVFWDAFGSTRRFRELFNARPGQWGGIVWGQPDPIVPELLRRVMLRRTREEVLPELPSKTFTDLTVNGISATLRSTLDAIWEEQGDWLEVEQGLPDFEEFSKVRAELAKAKIPALLELVEQHEEEGIPLVVGSDHLAPLDALGARPGWAVIKGGVPALERQRIVEAFTNGTLKGVAVQTTAGGVGLNLQKSWKLVHVDLNFVPAANAQLYDRLCRIGQTSSKIEIVRLVINHPLERHIHELVAKKTALFMDSIEKLMVAEKKDALQAPANPLQTETEEEYRARLAEMARVESELAEQESARVEAARVARAKEKVVTILDRERAKNPGYSRQEKPLTPTRIKSIVDGIRYLAGVCDGAVSLDGQGFSKSDAALGHLLSVAGLTEESELRAAEYVLLRYNNTQWKLSD